jgi:hypothetical protein
MREVSHEEGDTGKALDLDHLGLHGRVVLEHISDQREELVVIVGDRLDDVTIRRSGRRRRRTSSKDTRPTVEGKEKISSSSSEDRGLRNCCTKDFGSREDTSVLETDLLVVDVAVDFNPSIGIIGS